MKDNKEQLKKYHTVGTVPKSNKKISHTQSIHEAHIYMTARFSSLKQGF